MSGPAVTIVPEGGVPVTPVDSGAPLVTSVEAGGLAITLTPNATPMIIEGFTPNPPVLGPLDYATHILGAFDDFSREYDLASDAVVVGLSAFYTGNPVIEIAHGGEPIPIIRIEKDQYVLSLIAAAKGLTTEAANLTVKVTGGSVGGGAIRINEMVNMANGVHGWDEGSAVTGPSVTLPPVTGSSGGVTKLALASTVSDPSHWTTIDGAETVWNGYLVTGPLVDIDLTETGNWAMESGWEWVGTDLIHSGPASVMSTPVPAGATSRTTAVRAYVKIGANSRLNISVHLGGRTFLGPYEGYLYSGVAGNISAITLTGTGDVEIKEMALITQGRGVTWVFGGADTEEGAVYSSKLAAYGPSNALTAVEILADDYT